MDLVKNFNDAAASYGVGYAILIALVLGLIHVLWKLGSRLVDAHGRYLDATAEAQKNIAGELKNQTTLLTEIRTALPAICQAKPQVRR